MEEPTSFKKIYEILAVILLLVIAFVVYQVRRTNPSPLPSPGGTVASPGGTNITPPNNNPAPPSGTSAPSSSSGKISIKTQRGDFILVKNVYKDPAAQITGDHNVTFRDTPEYRLFYYEPTQSFAIAILNSDVVQARALAERAFLEALGITQEQACQLRVSLGVVTWANEIFADKNYGLSFCPDGVPFVNP